MASWHVTLSYSGTVDATDAEEALRLARRQMNVGVGMRLTEASTHRAPAASPSLPLQDSRHEHNDED